jgi:hypothetical protein
VPGRDAFGVGKSPTEATTRSACRGGGEGPGGLILSEGKVKIGRRLIKHETCENVIVLQGFQHRATAPGAVFSFLAAVFVLAAVLDREAWREFPDLSPNPIAQSPILRKTPPPKV